MEEKAEKQLNEMLDSVNSINDEFVNNYFSDDSEVDFNNDSEPVNEEIPEEDVELIKPEFEWDEMPIDEEINDDLELEPENDKFDDELSFKNENSETIGGDLDLEDINSFETNITSNLDEFDNINISSDEIEKQIESEDENELTSFATFDDDKTYQDISDDVSYRNLSGDELMKLLDKSKDGEDFFEKVEEIDD